MQEDKKTEKINNENEKKFPTPIFKIDGIKRTNTARIKLYSNCETVDIPEDIELIPYIEIINDTEVYKCSFMEKRFTADQLIGIKKIPVLHVPITFSRISINFEIIRFIVFFNADEEVNADSINKDMTGNFTLEVYNGDVGTLLKKYPAYIGARKIFDNLKGHILTNSFKKQLKDMKESKIEDMFGKNDIDTEIPKSTISLY